MKVLFLTDSLGYPRVDGNGATASDAWPYATRNQLQKASDDNECYFDMKPFRTTSTLVGELKRHIVSYKPKVIVLQVGIVDCYPRAITLFESQILPRIPVLRQITRHLVKRFYSRLVKVRNIAYVSEIEFSHNLEKLKDAFPGVAWLVIPIAPPSLRYKVKNIFVADRVERYNLLLERSFHKGFLEDLYSQADTEKLFLEDNHHLSIYGHNVVFNRVVSELKSFFMTDE